MTRSVDHEIEVDQRRGYCRVGREEPDNLWAGEFGASRDVEMGEPSSVRDQE